MRVVNVAVTQGSNKARQAGRWARADGSVRVSRASSSSRPCPAVSRRINADDTRTAIARTGASRSTSSRDILAAQRPRVVFFPHEADWNSTHIGTHHLLVDALGRAAAGFACTVVETEFWGAMATPNLMVESSVAGRRRR